jgi:hypothetical protein
MIYKLKQDSLNKKSVNQSSDDMKESETFSSFFQVEFEYFFRKLHQVFALVPRYRATNLDYKTR